MTPQKITDTFTVSPQISPGDAAAIAAMGFRSLICNRPDGEAPDQTPYAVIEAEAADAGLAFRHIPVVSGAMTQDDVDAMAAALERNARSRSSPIAAPARAAGSCSARCRRFRKMPVSRSAPFQGSAHAHHARLHRC